MSGAAILTYQTQVGRGHRRGERTNKGDNGLQASPTFHLQTERGGSTPDPVGRKTLVSTSRIRTLNENADIAEPSDFGGTRYRAGQGEPLVPDDSEVLELEPGAAPRNRLGGDRRLISASPLGKCRQRRARSIELGHAGVGGARGP